MLNIIIQPCATITVIKPIIQNQNYLIDQNKEEIPTLSFNFGPFRFFGCEDPQGFTYTPLLSNGKNLSDSLLWKTSLNFNPVSQNWTFKSNDTSLEGIHTFKL